MADLSSNEVQAMIAHEKVIGIVRLATPDHVYDVVDKIVNGGIRIVEITLTMPMAATVISNLRERYPSAVIGAGTVLTQQEAEAVLDAGTQFIVSPIFDEDVFDTAEEHNVLCIPGALTPTEIYHAHHFGANIVKPFPLTGLGPAYIKALKGPFPSIDFIPTNGVTIENMCDFFDVGCIAVGLGSSLVTTSDTMIGSFEQIRERARVAVNNVKKYDR